MNREAAFEALLAQWLEEGPYEAPREPVAAALAHVRSHPKRSRTLVSRWRYLMSGIGLTHVPSQPRRGWLATGAVIAGLAIVVVGAYGLFSFGGQTGPGGVATPTPVVTPTSSAGPTSTPTPTLGSGMATGTQSCDTSTEGVVTTIEGVDQSRGEVISCTNTSSDPRLSGAFTTTWNWDEHPDGLWFVWGTTELRNDGGAWTGTWGAESTTTASALEFDAVWIGSDGYEGLEVLNHVRITGEYTTTRSRVIEAGPTMTGTERCTTTSAGREVAAGEVTAYRGVTLRCTDTMADPRVSGTGTLKVSIDMRADESADIWGTNTLTNELGGWEGFFLGTVDPGYTTHHVKALLRGTGEYEGLLYRLEVLSPDGADAQLTGEIIPGW